MTEYIQLRTICRSKYIADYFEASDKPCGVCDNCLLQKRKPINIYEFEEISNTILQKIPIEGILITSLLQQHKYSKEKYWEVLEFLEQQELILTHNGVAKKLNANS